MRRVNFVAVVGIFTLIMSGTLFAQEQGQAQEQQESQTRAAIAQAVDNARGRV